MKVVLMVALLATLAHAAPRMAERKKDARCATLCEAGLGGTPCGCPPEQTATVLHHEVHSWRVAHPEEQVIRGPRRDLCPALCAQDLGQPLCHCSKAQQPQPEKENWCAICHDLLYDENAPELWLQLSCNDKEIMENCENNKPKLFNTIIKRELKNQILDTNVNNSTIVRNTEVDWNLWCEVQCDQNNGGLACNCDMLPLSAL